MPGEANTQTFSFETVAVLVAVLKDKGGNLGMKDYEQMAALDGSRSASGFDHLFRKVKSRANELLEAKGDGTAPATPKKKAAAKGKGATPATGESTGAKKRGRKQKADTAEDDEEKESPTKKVKKEWSANAEEDGDLA